MFYNLDLTRWWEKTEKSLKSKNIKEVYTERYLSRNTLRQRCRRGGARQEGRERRRELGESAWRRGRGGVGRERVNVITSPHSRSEMRYKSDSRLEESFQKDQRRRRRMGRGDKRG